MEVLETLPQRGLTELGPTLLVLKLNMDVPELIHGLYFIHHITQLHI